MSELRLEAGSVFAGDYKVIRPLRTGGQGSLYVVEQISTSKQRALKLMLPELVANATSRKRFELEAKIAARIQSDHIVETIASGVESDVPWLVMELLEGEDLSAHIQKRRALPPSQVLEIFGQLCHALGEAHRQGIVHRDLKPENIFLSASRRRGMPFMVKVLDFGIARVLAESKTQSGATVQGLGTPMWMAPEQTIPGGRVEPSTDVWPLGLLAFRLLTGYLFWKAPYDPSASVLMLMAEAFMHPMPTASKRAADYKCPQRIPAGFDEWFAKAVARNMDDRYADAAAAFTALEPILAAATDTVSESVNVGSLSGAGEGTANTGPGASTGASAKPKTGPGQSTWGGAPVLTDSAVISQPETSKPPEGRASPAPAPATPAPTTGGVIAEATKTPAPATGSGSTSVPTTTRASTADAPATKPRNVVGIIAAACIAGVVVGGALFVGSRKPRAAGANVPTAVTTTQSASAPPIVPAGSSAPSTSATPDVDASAPADSASTPADSAAGSASGAPGTPGGKAKKLCKPAGQKCLTNDDCCDRVCRAWKCRPNAALRDPYGNDEKP